MIRKVKIASHLRSAAMVAAAVLGSQSAFAGISVTIEASGVQSSQQANIITETFDAPLPTGVLASPLVSSIGTYTASPGSSIILAADQHGGANGTQYISVGAQAGSGGTLTLALNGPADYFGMWWSAIDGQNQLDLYSGATLVGHFDSTNLPAFSGAYFGNPNNGLNTGEPYAYVNFSGTAGTTFDRIVFTNPSSTGFESDNHSIHGVPEPSALLMGGAASVFGLVALRRRTRSV